MALNAGKDVAYVGGKLAAGADLALNAGGGVTVQAQELSTVKNASNFTTTHVKSALSAGGNVTINAKGDATIQASNVTSGKNTAITAGGGVTLSAAQDEVKSYSSHKSCDWLGYSCKTTVHSSDDITAVSTAIDSGGWVEIEAKSGDVAATATNVTAQASIKLLADLGNVLLEAGQNSSASRSYVKKSELWGLTGSVHSSASSSVTVAPTFVSAVNDVQLTSHADLVVKASSVKAGGNIAVTAQNIELIALQNTTYSYRMDENWGFYATAGAQQGSASVSVGWQDAKTTSATTEGLAQVSSLEAGGDISINAKGDITSQGAVVAASGSVAANAGGNIDLESAYDTYTQTGSKSATQIGVTVSASENVTSAINAYANAGKAFNAGQGGGANKAITQASEALQLAETTANLIMGPLVSVGASIGASYRTSNSSLIEHLAHPGYWVAGQDVSLASGNNVNIQGTVSQAGRCLSVQAANNLTIQSALSTISETSSSHSVNASVGVSVGLGFTGWSMAANVSAGFSNSSSATSIATNTMSQLSGGTVALKSGRDTTVAGATVTGGAVTADVGGKLAIESRQDTVTSRSSQNGVQLGLSIGLGGVSSTAPGSYAPNPNFFSDTGNMFSNAGNFLASGSGPLTDAGGGAALHNSGSFGFTYGRGSEDKAWTNTLTTLNGVNGLTLSVAGNTKVKGALIGSTGGSVFIDASGRVNAQGSIVESLAGNVTVTAPTIAMAAGPAASRPTLTTPRPSSVSPSKVSPACSCVTGAHICAPWARS